MTELDKLIQDRLNKPFEWGENDRITFCMDAIKCVTGIDHLKLENVRDWNTPQSAKKTLLKPSGDSSESFLDNEITGRWLV